MYVCVCECVCVPVTDSFERARQSVLVVSCNKLIGLARNEGGSITPLGLYDGFVCCCYA